ncbi:hypothetical protein ACI2VA_17110 [Ralstonia nicotianae]
MPNSLQSGRRPHKRLLYKPAIEAAGMMAYRVDQDSSATVLVEAIEKNIKRAAVCLADITEDNPNVWYELGFAYAAGRPVVMACSDERQKAGKRFPFDIQHRAIVTYKTESPRDFQSFKDNLTERLKAMLKQGEVLEEMAEQASVASVIRLEANHSCPGPMQNGGVGRLRPRWTVAYMWRTSRPTTRLWPICWAAT